MADSKITALTSIGASTDPANDPLVLVDVSDTSMAASGTTKKVTLNQLLGASGTATLASATITGDLTVDTSTLKVDSANNRVGIGTTSPAAGNLLHISGTAAVPLLMQRTGSNDVYLSFTDNSGLFGYFGFSNGELRLQTPGSSYANKYVISSDGTSTWSNVGGVAGTAMTLNSTGLGVGRSPSYKLDIGGTGTQTVRIQTTTSGDPTLTFEAAGADGGSILYDRTNGGMRFDISAITGAMRLSTTGNLGVGVTPAGTGGCLQLKSGITFPATQVASSDANTLDDYEEGTFTPTIIGTTTAGIGTYTTNQGRYTKIGNRVFCDVYISWSAHTGTGNLNLEGLPFTSNAAISAISIGLCSNISLTAGNIMTGVTTASSTQIYFQQYPSGGGARSVVPMDTAGEIQFSVCYFV
jgi:hypothetical protein